VTGPTALSAAQRLAVLVAGTGGPVGVTVDGRAVPMTALGGPGEWAVFRWGLAPAGLATYRQLAACGLRPGGAAPVAELAWRRGRRVAHLYLVSAAKPQRPMTDPKRAALAAANRARRTCPDCGADAGYVIPPSLGMCVDCKFGPADLEDAA
jgi:hypothetical protein